MFLINGSINYSEIDSYSNSFSIKHEFGLIKSSSNVFIFELGDYKRNFRPASIRFGYNEIKVSIGTYKFNKSGVIRYSFTALKLEEEKKIGYSPYLYINLDIIQSSIIFARMNIRGIVPGDVVIKSDIEFNVIQANRTPRFYWDTPSGNADSSNSSSISKPITGYYYAFNKIENYFVTKSDIFIPEKQYPYLENEVYVNFPSSGTYFFHIKAVNSTGNISRNTSHATVIYNSPPSKPINLKFNGYSYYTGPTNYNMFSWNESSNSDEDEIKYEMKIYRNSYLYYDSIIDAMRCKDIFLYCKLFVRGFSIFHSQLYIVNKLVGRMRIDSDKYIYTPPALYGKLNIIGFMYGKLYIYPCMHGKMNIYVPGYNGPNIVDDLYGFSYKFSDNLIKKREEGRIYYKYSKDLYKNIHGSYSYMVRAYDWADMSDWSNMCYYDIINEKINFYSKMWIGYQDTDKELVCKLFIFGSSLLYGYSYIIPTIIGKMNMCRLRNASPLYGTLYFKEYFDLLSKMFIDTNFSDVYGKLYISCVPGSSFLHSRMRIVFEEYENLYGRMVFRDNDIEDLYGAMFIRANGNIALDGYMIIIKEIFYSRMIIKRLYSNDNSYENGGLSGRMSIDNYPPEPIIVSDVGNDWQPSSIINFSWEIPETKINVIAYEYFLSQEPITSFSSISFFRTAKKEASINLKNYNDDGEYYFYVRSVADNGDVSYPSVCIVRYNNKPSTPSYPMYVNWNECIDNTPIISKDETNNFIWPRSTHIDRDNVGYNIQISQFSDFSNIVVDIKDIYDTTGEDFISYPIKNSYSNEYSVYYWRVRAYDLHEYTDFGYVGRFRCNTRPGVPTNLSVENEV